MTKARRYKWGETNTLPTVGANKIGTIIPTMLSEGATRTWLILGLSAPFQRPWYLFEYREHCLRDYGKKLSSSRESSRHYRTIWSREIYICISTLLSQKAMEPIILPEIWIPSVGTQNISSLETRTGLGENYINCEKTTLVIISLQCTLSFYLIWVPLPYIF